MWITLIKINQKKLVRTEKNVYLCRVANELQEFFEISVSNYKWVYPYEDRYARTLNQQKNQIAMYGILDMGTSTLTNYSNVITLKQFASLIVRRAVKEDNDGDINAYLDGWVECLNECSDGEHEYTMDDVACQASDNLVYSNAHYYKGRMPLTSAEKDELCKEVEKYLERYI